MTNTRPSRTFSGNSKYLTFYNRHVHETFNPYTSSPIKSDLASSKITTSGKIYPNSKYCPGTSWTKSEKEIFFNLLQRTPTIPQILDNQEQWKSNLPKKSIFDIITYHNILKKELRRLKRKKSRKLIKYGDFPIAYEISPFFIHFEELQADMITRRESTLLMEKNRRIIKSSTTTPIEPIIDVEKLMKVLGCKVSHESLVLFDELARLVIRKIITNMIVDRGVNKRFQITEVVEAIKGLHYSDADLLFNTSKRTIFGMKRVNGDLIIKDDDEVIKKVDMHTIDGLIRSQREVIEEGDRDDENEMDLTVIEAEVLDEQDGVESRMYERGLVTMLMDDELLNSGITKEDEKLAQEWMNKRDDDVIIDNDHPDLSTEETSKLKKFSRKFATY
ncbi:hypothetical protein G210_1923 [Candida maltosa Xu316]|uniref:Uncharacterized protein n=1 Tax=Candida maltosa (strain Xu316) TaxID=1245528 RepID=M3HJW4_CANMX|nr:hypothetical protein G210_1923 [Candida maltosa Xu316]